MKKFLFLIFLFSVGLLLTWCGTQPETCAIEDNFSCEADIWTIENTWALDLSGTLDAVLLDIKNMDLLSLSQFVWPEWLRFSPYEYVDTESDVVLTKEILANGLALSRTFMRWTQDGSGFPIDLWIAQYREKYVYDVDFINAPEVHYNQKFNRGNTLNTIFDVYKDKEIIEYHFPQIDPQYEGMDWRSLYVVFENIDGQRYLIGIVHGQWTI